MKSGQADRMVLLDGIRGLAAIGVVLFHVQFDDVTMAFSRGYLFVDLFFLLSGFVITLAFEPRFARGLGVGRFFAQRLSRFRPLILVGASLGILGLVARGQPLSLSLAAFALGVGMIPLPSRGPIFPVNGPQWSLFLELMANALHAVLLHRLRSRTLLAIAAASAIAMMLLAAKAGTLDLGLTGGQFPAAVARTGWSYILGVILARRWRVAPPARLADWRVCLVLPVVVVCVLPFLPGPDWLRDVAVVMLVFPTVFWMAAAASPPVWARRPLAALGAISFPLYAVHMPILILGNHLGDLPGRIVAAAMALTLATLLAMVSGRRAGPAADTPVSPRASFADA